MSYDFVYYFTREYIEGTKIWDINYPNRVDSHNDQVCLNEEIDNKFPSNPSMLFIGYEFDPKKVAVKFENELNDEDVVTLTYTVYRHKNNMPDKYGVWYQESFVQDPANPGNAYLFDTKELAEQFIINDGLTGAVAKGVVVL